MFVYLFLSIIYSSTIYLLLMFLYLLKNVDYVFNPLVLWDTVVIRWMAHIIRLVEQNLFKIYCSKTVNAP